MKYTSAEANKLLRSLNEEYESIIAKEKQSKDFLAALGEDPETVRPKYDYRETQNNLNALEEKIRKLKHAINVFNTTHIIPEFEITIDELLVLIPQLSKQKAKLTEMKDKLPKAREKSYGNYNHIIDYRYTNYRAEAVTRDYETVSKKLADAQTALDKINNSISFDFE